MEELRKRCIKVYSEKHGISCEEALALFKEYKVQELLTMSYPDMIEMDDNRLLTELELYFEVSSLRF